MQCFMFSDCILAPPLPRLGGVRPFHQQSTCLTQSIRRENLVPRNGQFFDQTKLSCSTEWLDATRASIQEQLLRMNVKRFRSGLVFKAHRLLFHSTLGLRVIKKKKTRAPQPPASVPRGPPPLRHGGEGPLPNPAKCAPNLPLKLIA